VVQSLVRDAAPPKQLRFHWSMSSAGVAFKGAMARAAQPGVPDLDAYLDYCRCAEASGIDSLLTAIGFHRPDPLVLATALGVRTESINFMLAIRSGIASPTLVVQQINTLSTILGGRLHLNIVAGHTPGEQRGYGDFLDHDQRYARTGEFLSVCRELWANTGPVDFEGRYYRVEQAGINTPWCSPHGTRPEIYVGGKSPAAIELALAHADCLWTMPERPMDLRERMAPLHAGGVEVGLLVSLIARPTRDEALAAAQALLDSVGGAPRRTHAEFSRRSDSVAFTSTLATAEAPDAAWLTPTLFTGLVSSLGAPAIAFVGSYDEVAATLLEYRRIAGVTQYLFMGWPDLDEMVRFDRELRPRVRALEALES
jgi:alkanesulfonate monooxygenase